MTTETPAQRVVLAPTTSRESEGDQRLRSLIDGLDAIVWEVDPVTLQCTFVNRRAASMLGYPVEQWLSEPHFWPKYLHAEDRECVLTVWHAVLADGKERACEHRYLAADGRLLWFRTTLRLMPGDTTRPGWLHGLMIDITERKQAEEERAQLCIREQRAQAEAEVLRATDRLKSEFIASISHELRTPLHHIKGYASTLLRLHLQFDPTTIQDYLHIITEESDKLERLIVDLLDTSRIETNSLTLDLESVQLDELIGKLIQRWQRADDHTFAVCMPHELPPVPADPYRIEQVLDNLLANVVRHTPAQTHTIVSVDVNREHLIVSVADQGPGIGAEHIPYLFDRFYQAEPQAYRHRHGSGLGLFICKGIIEQHGGSIWVELAPDVGATFRFSLPRRRSRVKRAARTSDSGNPPRVRC
jgi:PAS domain S-box-containing protein